MGAPGRGLRGRVGARRWRRPATGWARCTRGRGRRAQVVAAGRAAAARQRQGRPAGARGARGGGRVIRVFSSRCAPASAASPSARACCSRERPAGGSGARSPSTTPRPRDPWLRAAEEAAAGDWPAPLRDARARQRHGARVRARERAHAIVPRRRLHDRQGQGRRGRPDPRRRRGPAGGGARRARPRRPIRVDANGGWDVDEAVARDPRCSSGPRAAWSTSSSPARPSRSWPPYAARSTCRRRRRVDPPGRGPLPGARPRGGRHRRAQGAAARRRARLPADRRGHRPAGRRVSAPRVQRRHRGRGRAGGRAAGAAARLRPGHRAAAHRRRGHRAAAAGRRRCCRSARRSSTPPRSTGWPRRRSGSAWWERLAEVRPCGRISPRDTPRPPWPATSSTALLAAGVREVVLAPGSRNAPLSFAVHDAGRAGLLRLHTRVDERTAGFLALGLDQGGRPGRRRVHLRARPSPTSTPPSWRPPTPASPWSWSPPTGRPGMRGTGANQTTDQVGVFGRLRPDDGPRRARPGRRLVLAADGPVHLNVQLDEPLLPEDRWTDVAARRRVADVRAADRASRSSSRPAPAPSWWPATTPARRRGCWPRTPAGRCWPSRRSGSRTGDHAIRTYRLLLGSDLGDRVERVVVAGHPTLSRPVTRLLGREDVEVVSMRSRGIWPARPFPVDRRGRPASVDDARRPRVARGVARRRPVRSAASSTGCWPPSPTSRRTRSPARSAARCPPRGCWTSAPPTRSATST